MSKLLDIRDLAIGYRNHAVLKGINLTLGTGELTSLLGSNGAGKSTLLRTIAGTLAPVSGEIQVNGKPLRSLSAQSLAKVIAIVNTERTMAGCLTVRELVGLGRHPFTGFMGQLSHEDKERVEQAMRQVGIEHKAACSMASLSDGERQKAMIAKALAQDTPLILMDEPTAFLDAASRIEMMSLLASLAHEQGKSILLSTHDIAPAVSLSDRLWLMMPDGSVAQGTPAAMAATALPSIFAGRSVTWDNAAGDFRAIKH
ncbi:MAG: ABC transporter ATP-binding protein [Bacteroidales bacterium]|nr:ABC transporter ATP-binding protein [Bacteroidales bacterium]